MKEKPTPSVDTLLRQLTAAVETSSFPVPVKFGAEQGLRRRIRTFLECPASRRDPRRIKESKRRARKALEHIFHAVRHAYVHEDANVRTRARELVRSLQYLPSFAEIENQAGEFNRFVRKVEKRQNEKERKKSRFQSDIRRSNLVVVELNSVRQLRNAGRALGLCVAHRDDIGREYHDRLREEVSNFYYVARHVNRNRRTKRLLGLIEIDRETRRVLDTKGRGNKVLKLKRKVACEVLRVLEATANDIDTFTRVGAFSFVLDSSPKNVNPLQVDGYEYRFWFDPDGKRIAIHKRRAMDALGNREGSPKRKWSLFEWGDQERRMRRRFRNRRRPENCSAEWREVSWHRGAMNAGELLHLAMRSPEIAERIREAFYQHTGPVEDSDVDLDTWNPAWNPDDFLAAALPVPTELDEVIESIPALGDGTESWTQRLPSQ